MQAKEITREQASGLFWANVVLGIVSSVVLGASGSLMAHFFGRQELIALAPAYAGSLLISSLSTQHVALLRRHLAFRHVAVMNISAALGSTVVAVVLAWRGWGYWALVAMVYTNALISGAVAWYAMKWLPGPARRGVGLRKLMGFGGFVAGSNVLYLVSENVVPIIIGRTAGTTDVGLFGRASRLTEQIIDQVTAPLSQVVLPALSKLQDERLRMREAICQILEKITVLTFALAGFLAVGGSDVVLLLLGRNWRNAGPVVQLLAVGALAWPMSRVLASAMIASGHSRAMFAWGWLSLAVRLLTVGVGAAWGLVGVSAGIAMSQWIGLALFSLYVGTYLPFSMSEIVRQLYPSAIAVAFAMCATALLASTLIIDHLQLRLAIVLAAFVSLYVIGHGVTKAGRRVLKDTLGFTQEIFSRRS